MIGLFCYVLFCLPFPILFNDYVWFFIFYSTIQHKFIKHTHYQCDYQMGNLQRLAKFRN